MDLASVHYSAEDVSAKTQLIHDRILSESKRARESNFSAIHSDDLAHAFALYDQSFFNGWLARTVIEKTKRPLSFRLSPTMTRAGGKTICIRRRVDKVPTGFEIAIASRLLFITFSDIDRPVNVSGLRCDNRLQALQRILEHEIIHLAELLAWDNSSCSANRFRMLAKNIFGHTKITHNLVTPIELAAAQHSIGLGQRVQFTFHGARHIGVVNRIHRRATVLVESAQGTPHSDGRRYLKFYMPLQMLSPAS